MLNKTIFKAYDVRGIYPTDVNKESIKTISEALCHILDSGEVIIGHDGRHGSKELAEFAVQIISEYGNKIGKTFKTTFIGLATTPMYYFLVNKLNASGGAMFTASHNPKEYTGVKAVKKNAEAISGKDLLGVIEKFKLN